MAVETSMDVLGVDHVDLTVNDLARSIPFYEKVLGALGFRRVPHATYDARANAHLAIVLRPAAREAAFDRARVGLHHLALRVRRRDAADRFHGCLVREGITALDPPTEDPEYGPQYHPAFPLRYSPPRACRTSVAGTPRASRRWAFVASCSAA